jgi:DNA gyrase subunit B
LYDLNRVNLKDEIVVLPWYEAIRRRPALYIGDTGRLGLRFLARELFECPLAPQRLNVVVEQGRLAIRTVSVPVSVQPRQTGQPIYLIEVASRLPVAIDEPPSIALMEILDLETNPAVFRRIPVAPSAIAIANALTSEMTLVSYCSGAATAASFSRGELISTTTTPTTSEDGLAIELVLDTEIFAHDPFRFEDLAEELRDFGLRRQVDVELRDVRRNLAFGRKCTG